MADVHVQLASLDRQTQKLASDCAECGRRVLELRLAKLTTNLDHVRAQATLLSRDEREQTMALQDRLIDIETYLYRSRHQEESPVEAASATTETTLSSHQLLDELNTMPTAAKETESMSQLRRRKAPSDDQEKLDMETDIQQEVSEDILEMVRTIKRNAELFAKKLDADNSVVDSAATAIANAASKMDSVGSRLQSYRRSSALGFWFYVKAAVFLAVSLIGGMLLIQLFPKW